MEKQLYKLETQTHWVTDKDKFTHFYKNLHIFTNFYEKKCYSFKLETNTIHIFYTYQFEIILRDLIFLYNIYTIISTLIPHCN